MGKQIKCPWCKELMVPKLGVLERKIAKVTERRCSKCGKIVAAYLSDEKFLDGIRKQVMTFKD